MTNDQLAAVLAERVMGWTVGPEAVHDEAVGVGYLGGVFSQPRGLKMPSTSWSVSLHKVTRPAPLRTVASGPKSSLPM